MSPYLTPRASSRTCATTWPRHHPFRGQVARTRRDAHGADGENGDGLLQKLTQQEAEQVLVAREESAADMRSWPTATASADLASRVGDDWIDHMISGTNLTSGG